MAVVAYIDEINPKHGVLAECTVKIDENYKLRVQLMKHRASGKYRIQSADLDRRKFVTLGYDFVDLKERITDAVAAKYERSLRYECVQKHSPTFAAYENTIQMEVERIQQKYQHEFKEQILHSYESRKLPLNR